MRPRTLDELAGHEKLLGQGTLLRRAIELALRADNGTLYGPWWAVGQDGFGGVRNAYWLVTPDTVIPAGIYTVIDSDPLTWAQNEETEGRGISRGYGIPRK